MSQGFFSYVSLFSSLLFLTKKPKLCVLFIVILRILSVIGAGTLYAENVGFLAAIITKYRDRGRNQKKTAMNFFFLELLI